MKPHGAAPADTSMMQPGPPLDAAAAPRVLDSVNIVYRSNPAGLLTG